MSKNALSSNFTGISLLRYSFPSILTMLFMSAYTIVDGVFVSKFINEHALSAVNIVFPLYAFVLAIGLMFASGASAVIGKLMGENNNKKARQFFTFLYIVSTIVGLLFSLYAITTYDALLEFVGTSDILYPYAKDYFLTLAPFAPMLFLQIYTQYFFVSAGKPKIGLYACFVGGISNIILDYIFIVLFDMGVAGAAFATGIGFALPGIFGVLYFSFRKKSFLRFTKPAFLFKELLLCMYNGLSELIGNLSLSITTFIFNMTLLKLAGESGVAAITVILYVAMFQTAMYYGFTLGISPVISFKYGEQNHKQLKKIINISTVFIISASVITIILSFIFAEFAVSIFISRQSSTFDLTVFGFKIYSIAYIFMGLNILTSAGFTALSNGTVSGILSVVRSLVLIVTALLLLPKFLGILGVWLAVPIAELFSLFLSIYFYKNNKERYKY